MVNRRRLLPLTLIQCVKVDGSETYEVVLTVAILTVEFVAQFSGNVCLLNGRL